MAYPLIAASSEGHNQIAKRLAEKGADANAKGDYGGSALQAACLNGHSQIVDWHLEQGAYVNDHIRRYSRNCLRPLFSFWLLVLFWLFIWKMRIKRTSWLPLLHMLLSWWYL
jgi:ankyrin repeat protein